MILKNKKQKLNLFFLMLLGAFLCFPLLVKKFKFIPNTKLTGIANVQPHQKLSIKNLMRNDFQKSYENYFMKSNPLWGYLVKINNQISYNIFNQITFSYGPEALIGLDKSLFQPMYLNSFNRQYTPDNFLLIKKANKLKKLENLLHKKGVKLLVVVNPNNIAMYPEIVPSQFIDNTRLSRENSYEIMKKHLSDLNIPLVDNYELLMKMKNKVNFKFFEPTGSHLNDIGACIGTNNLIKHINKQLPSKHIKSFHCFPIVEKFPPKNEDTDLLKVSNLLFPNMLLRPGHYTPTAKKLYKEPPLKLLFVGTSFNFATQSQLFKRNIAKSKLYFYYRTLRSDRGTFHILDKKKIDWENDVFKNDVIILESNYSGLGGVGYSFISDAIIKLKKQLFTSEKDIHDWQKEIKPQLIKQEKIKSKNNSQIDEFNPFANKS